jgi:hypothetical protein
MAYIFDSRAVYTYNSAMLLFFRHLGPSSFCNTSSTHKKKATNSALNDSNVNASDI